jgi:hypothetical protein
MSIHDSQDDTEANTDAARELRVEDIKPRDVDASTVAQVKGGLGVLRGMQPVNANLPSQGTTSP